VIKFTIVVTISAEVNDINVTELEASFRRAQKCFWTECKITVTLHPVEQLAARRALKAAGTVASSTASVFKDGNTLSAVRDASYEFAGKSATQAGDILNQPVGKVYPDVNEREDTEPRAVAPPPPSVPPTKPPPSSPSPNMNPQSTDPPCFPSSATAALRDGRTVRLDELREGDAILVGWADGTLGFDVVTPWSLADLSAEGALFLALATSANTTLRLTPTHHLPVGETCCKQLTQAKDVRVGELVWAVGRGAAEPEPHAILSVRATRGRGLHSPLMQRGGFPVVDGVLTSFNSLPLVKLNAIAQPYLFASLCTASTSACTAARRVVAAVECVAKHAWYVLGSFALAREPLCKTLHYIDGPVVHAGSLLVEH